MLKTTVRSSLYAAFQLNIIRTKLIQDIKFVDKTTYKTGKCVNLIRRLNRISIIVVLQTKSIRIKIVRIIFYV